MKLELVFNTNDKIKIELLKNQTMEKWFDHFSVIYEQKPPLNFSQDGYYYLKDFGKNWDEIKTARKQLKKAQAQLIDLGFGDIKLSKRFDYNQQTLNKLHRIFTLNVDETDNVNIQYWLHQINNNVHILEKYTEVMPNLRFIRNRYPINLFTVRLEKPNSWIEFDSNDLQHNYTYLDMDYKNIVFLDQSILGKCVLQSFAEHDDPTQPDCTGRLGAYGGFQFDMNPANRHNIYRSKQFKSWCKSWRVNPKSLPLEFPIGYISYTTQDLNYFYFLKGIKLQEIKFIK